MPAQSEVLVRKVFVEARSYSLLNPEFVATHEDYLQIDEVYLRMSGVSAGVQLRRASTPVKVLESLLLARRFSFVLLIDILSARRYVFALVRVFLCESAD